MSIHLVDETPLLSNIRLVPNLDLLANFPDSRKPKGAIILLYNGDDVNKPPVVTFDNIATEYTLNFVN
jgi:predicted ribosome-associated RNA-binding protein Tma20